MVKRNTRKKIHNPIKYSYDGRNTHRPEKELSTMIENILPLKNGNTIEIHMEVCMEDKQINYKISSIGKHRPDGTDPLKYKILNTEELNKQLPIISQRSKYAMLFLIFDA